MWRVPSAMWQENHECSRFPNFETQRRAVRLQPITLTMKTHKGHMWSLTQRRNPSLRRDSESAMKRRDQIDGSKAVRGSHGVPEDHRSFTEGRGRRARREEVRKIGAEDVLPLDGPP